MNNKTISSSDFIQLTNSLICEIQKLSTQIQYFDSVDIGIPKQIPNEPKEQNNENENNYESSESSQSEESSEMDSNEIYDTKYEDDDFIDFSEMSPKELLQMKETEYDKLYEKYLKAQRIVQTETIMRNLFESFNYHSHIYYNRWKNITEETGNKLNEILEDIREIENKVDETTFTIEYENQNVDSCQIQTEYWKESREYEKQKKKSEKENRELRKQNIEKEAVFKRRIEFKDFITINELQLLEKQTGRFIDKNIFDSHHDNWKLNESEFFNKVKGKSDILIVVETSYTNKIGIFLHNPITKQGEYLTDSKSFVFRMDNHSMDKFPIVDESKAIKISNLTDNELFVIGESDIIIMKNIERIKRKCQCIQKSFNYKNRADSLVTETKYFEVLRVVVMTTFDEKELKKRNKETEIKMTNEIKRLEHRIQYIDNEINQLKTTKQVIISSPKRQAISEFVSNEEINALNRWTQLQCSYVVFDSTIDDWSISTSIFNDVIIGKNHLAFLIETEQGDSIGYYFNPFVTNVFDEWIEADKKSFHFNLGQTESNLKQMMKYDIKEPRKAGITLFDKSDEWLVKLGDIYLFKKNNAQMSYCVYFDNHFDYCLLPHPLTKRNEYFTLKRIRVIQMVYTNETKNLIKNSIKKSVLNSPNKYDEQVIDFVVLNDV